MGASDTFQTAPIAAFLLRQTGNAAEARRIAAAFARSVDVYWKPVAGPEMPFTLIVRARMAAVTGARAGVIDNLKRYHERGGIVPAFLSREPLFQAYKDDPELADLFAKAAVRREEARQRLRAEGL